MVPEIENLPVGSLGATVIVVISAASMVTNLLIAFINGYIFRRSYKKVSREAEAINIANNVTRDKKALQQIADCMERNNLIVTPESLKNSLSEAMILEQMTFDMERKNLIMTPESLSHCLSATLNDIYEAAQLDKEGAEAASKSLRFLQTRIQPNKGWFLRQVANRRRAQ